MAISKENLNVYISLSKKDGKQAVNAFLVPETRRRELLGRMSQIYTSACKGIKLSALEITQISAQNEKMARDLLTALFGANASDFRTMDFTASGNAKTMVLLQMLLSSLAPLFKNQQVLLYADGDNLRLNQLQSALKKAGLQAAVQSESFGTSPGLQISRFLGDLYLSDHLPQAKGQLLRELAYEKRVRRQDGDAAYLASIVPPAQHKAYQKLSRLPAATLESWAKKGANLRTLENAAALLAEGFTPEELAACSASKLSRPLEELKQMRRRTDPVESSQPTPADPPVQVAPAASGPKPSESAVDKKPSGSSLEAKTPRAHPQMEPKKQAAKLTSTQKDWQTYAAMIKAQVRDTCSNREAALLQNGETLRAGMQERLWRMCQEQPTLDVWIQEDGSCLDILVSDEKDRLLQQMETAPAGEPDSDLYRIYRFEGETFRLRLQTLMAWLSGLGRRYFLHVPAYMETEIKHSLLEQNWMIPMGFETLHFPRARGTLKPEAGTAGKSPYVSEQTLDGLSEEALRVLALPDLSIALTKLMARAFVRGLDPEEAESIYYHTEGRIRQERMRSLAGQYVFTTACRREMEEVLSRQGDLLLWDFLSHPALSSTRRQLILEAVDRGWTLEQIRRAITVRSTTSAIQAALQGTPEGDPKPAPAIGVRMPKRVRADLESWGAAQLNKRKTGPDRNKSGLEPKTRSTINRCLSLLEERPLG